MENLSEFFHEVSTMSRGEKNTTLVKVINGDIPKFRNDLDSMLRAVKHLLLFGADPDSYLDGNPLSIACRNNYTDIAIELLNNGACPDIMTWDGFSFYMAANNNNVELVNTFIKHGVNPHIDEDLFYSVCEKGNTEILKILLNYTKTFNFEYSKLLDIASENGHYDIVTYLINFKSKSCRKDSSSLYLASKNGHYNIVKFLLEKNFDPTADNSAALCIACEKNYLETTKLLLDFGADPDADESVPMFNACKNFNTAMVISLVEHGADLYGADGVFFSYYLEKKMFFDNLPYDFEEKFFNQPVRNLIKFGANADLIFEIGCFNPTDILSDEETRDYIAEYEANNL